MRAVSGSFFRPVSEFVSVKIKNRVAQQVAQFQWATSGSNFQLSGVCHEWATLLGYLLGYPLRGGESSPKMDFGRTSRSPLSSGPWATFSMSSPRVAQSE